MRILALDIGARRVGVAVSDPLGWTAQGLPTLARENDPQLIEAVRRITRELDVERVVIGLPRNMNGTVGPQAKKALAFAEALRAALQLPVETWDERLTTVAAERSLAEGGLDGRKRRRSVDRVAAQLILQGFLDSLNRDRPR
jgi:putative Holliday junction resolvase